MYEGKIIKFYREKYKLTQEQLGKDVCSITHISKIECNQTTYSTEIISLYLRKLLTHPNYLLRHSALLDG